MRSNTDIPSGFEKIHKDGHANYGRKLSTGANTMIDKGWEFYVEEWTSGHNGDSEYSFYFRSPRMKSIGSYGSIFDLDIITTDTLEDIEADHLARKYMESRSIMIDVEREVNRRIAKKFRNGTEHTFSSIDVNFTLHFKK